jgi:hypothetical protein
MELKMLLHHQELPLLQEQLRKILNYTNTIYIVFDGDEAGQKHHGEQ